MQTIEIIAACIGILYVWLEIKASIWLWPVGIILPIFYIYISLQSHVYGNIALNVYYLIACIYGWILWKRAPEKAEDDKITHVSNRVGWLITLITVILTIIIAFLFKRYTDNNMPILDAFATSLGVVGMWLLAKKHIENWYCWILSNFIYTIIFFKLNYIVTGIFFTIYTLFAIYGWYNWRKMKSKEATAA